MLIRMKLFIFLLVLCTFQTSQAEPFASNFSLSKASGSYAVGTSAMIAINLNFIADAPLQIGSIYWRPLNSATGEFLGPWQSDSSHFDVPAGGTFTFSTQPDAATTFAMVSALNQLQILVSLNSPQAEESDAYMVDVGQVCSTSPGNFTNLTTQERGCQSSSAENSAACTEEKEFLQSLLVKKLINCTQASSTLKSKNCPAYDFCGSH
jgi:hypothetical protein